MEEDKEHIEKATDSKERILVRVSRILSGMFTPFMVPFIAFLLLFFFTYLSIMPTVYKLFMLGLVYVFTILMPMLAIYLYHRLNRRSIRALRHRKNRSIPYALSAISYCACLIILYRLHVPRYLSGIVMATLICMLVCTLINFKWKVSAHVASCGMLVGGLLSYSFLFNFNPVWWLCTFILLSGLLGTARIIVRQHTLLEVIGGFVVGMFCGIVGILFI